MHAKDTTDFARLDPELEKHLERWKRAEFPFPIVLDGSGATAERYGARGYPTTVLVGPDGKVLAADGGTARLREILSKGR